MKKLTVSILVVLAAWAVVAVMVLAEEPPDGTPSLDDRLDQLREDMATTDSNETTTLTQDGNSEGDAAADLAPNPYGCYGQTDNPMPPEPRATPTSP